MPPNLFAYFLQRKAKPIYCTTIFRDLKPFSLNTLYMYSPSSNPEKSTTYLLVENLNVLTS